MNIKDGYKFDHNGFSCEVVFRPDRFYTYNVFGCKGGKCWIPKIYGFDKDLSFAKIKRACIDLMCTGKFGGVINSIGIVEEVYD